MEAMILEAEKYLTEIENSRSEDHQRGRLACIDAIIKEARNVLWNWDVSEGMGRLYDIQDAAREVIHA